MKTNKIYKSIIKTILCLACAFTFVLPQVSHIQAKDVYYEITFRAGAHASFDGKSKVVKTVKFKDAFPDVPDLTIEEGYVFKEWSKELPKVGSPVESKQTYVAKCVPVVSGQQYTVKYVDQNDVDIISPKIRIGELGSTVTERAKTIEDWPVDQAEKSITITNQTNEIKFVYTVPADQVRTEYVTEYETNVVDQVTTVVDNTGTPAAPVTPAPGTPENPGDDVTNVDDNQTPQSGGDTTDIPDNQTPQAKGQPTDNATLITGAVGLGIILILAAYLVARRKHGTEK